MVHRPPALIGPPSRLEPPRRIAILIALAVLESAWLAWCLLDPLPNAGGKGIRRLDLLIRAVPEIVVPGLRFRESYLGLALAELSHVENLPQRVPIVLAAAFIATSAIAGGNLVLRGSRLRDRLGRLERLAVGYGLGTTALGLATLILGRLGLLDPRLIRATLLIPIAAELIAIARDRRKASAPLSLWERAGVRVAASPPASGTGSSDRPQAGETPHPGPLSKGEGGRTEEASPRLWSPWALVGFGMVVGPFLLIMALGAMLPTIDFDAIEYHVQGPKEYYQAGRIAFLPHNVYTSMPFGIEMLHLLGMEVVGDWWLGALVGQLLVAAFAPAAAVLIALTARRLGSSRAALVAAVAYLTTPWIYRLAVLPYVEGPICYFHAALLWAVVRARTSANGLLVGLLAGGAMAIKYPALISAVIPFAAWAAWTSWRSKTWRVAVGYASGVAIVMAPWLAKNVVDTGNPVYPLGYKVFGASHWDPARDAKWSAAHGTKPIEAKAFGQSIVDVAGRSDWQSPLFAALAPLALFCKNARRPARWLVGYSAYLFLTWWLFTHRLDRFWLPILAPLSILAGLGSDWSRSKPWTAMLGGMMALSIASNAVYCSTALAGLNEWTGDLSTLRVRVPKMLNPPLSRLDAELPPGSKPLLVGQAAVFHLNRPIVYNTVFNDETIETLARGRSPRQLGEELRRIGVTHVYVDWFEIERYRSPGNYGFTPFVTPDFFDRLVGAGILGPPSRMGMRQELYEVKAPRRH